jgi:hypothetical protein
LRKHIERGIKYPEPKYYQKLTVEEVAVMIEYEVERRK